MKLPEHVDNLRILITTAFDKQFSRLGISPTRRIELERLPQELHARRRRFEEMLQSHLGETGSYENAREKLLDELTFTLFNRIAAVKVMEAANLLPPIITKQPEHGDRSFGHKAWLEIRPDMRSEELEGIREYIMHAFNELGETLPLYSRSYPYALLPDTISLNEIIDAFNAVEKDPQVGSEIWQSDDVLGWLYESYNNTKKASFKDSGEKTEYDKVSLQSQIYTPRWVVQFLVENSLGKIYLEMYPDSEIKNRYKIANAPEDQERRIKPVNDIKLLDPACGSGNFLLYAFDLFYEMYLDQIENYGADYNEEDVPQLIIKHNLHGIDIDDRAVQLAQLGLYIKARRKHRDIRSLQFNVISSDFYLPNYDDVRDIFEVGTQLDQNQKALIEDIWGDLQDAYKFGSLIRLDEKLNSNLRELVSKREKVQPQLFTENELGIKSQPVQRELFIEHDIVQERKFAANFFSNLKTAVEQYAETGGNNFLANKTRDAITFLELLTTKYDVTTANPPYTDDRDFGTQLKSFLDANYQKPMKFNNNLFATFFKRCYEFTDEDGRIGLIHPLTFMYIKTFRDMRKFMLNQTHIDMFIEFGLGGIFMTTKVDVDVAGYILTKYTSNWTEDSFFMNLQKYKGLKIKRKIFEKAYKDYILGNENEHNYSISQSKLKIIKSWPFIYWISDEFRDKFKLQPISEVYDICNGISSGGNNERFYRFWWEVKRGDILNSSNLDSYKWVTINKGGDFNKWYGNLWLVFRWESNGEELKKLKSKFPAIRFSYENYYFHEGLAFSGATSKGLSVRYQPPNCIFERTGKSIFGIKQEDKNYYYLLSLLNSKIVNYISDCLNPTVNIQAGDIERIPYIIPSTDIRLKLESLSKQNVLITKHIQSFNIFDFEFSSSPIYLNKHLGFRGSIKFYLDYENYLQTQVLINEAIIDEKIYSVYNLSEHDKAMVVTKVGQSIGSLPVSEEARAAFLAEVESPKEFPLDNTRNYIEVLPVKEFTSNEREAIETEFSYLYQHNNDLETFCIRHQVNPINVWYWFKKSNLIPKQRMNTLAMDFLTDMIREILIDDNDGVIPLVPNAGEQVLLDRIEEKFRQRGFSTAQYSRFDTILGWSLNEYISKSYFSELSGRLNLFRHFPMTPFIWHLTSGPEQGFECYLTIYKWSRDKLMRIRSVYIERRERALINRQSDLAGNDSAEAQNEKDKIFKQLGEIETFKQKIDELLAEGYDPKLDDGVGKNIAPLQKKKMIPYEVLNAGQLKKYLNADW